MNHRKTKTHFKMKAKRIPLKRKLAPRNATTFSKICSLETDHNNARNAWISVQEKTVFIANQKKGHGATETILLSRKNFERFIDWYNKQQRTFK